jgi:hypothetical protein
MILDRKYIFFQCILVNLHRYIDKQLPKQTKCNSHSQGRERRVVRAFMREQERTQRIGMKGDSNKINHWADAQGKSLPGLHLRWSLHLRMKVRGKFVRLYEPKSEEWRTRTFG